jgi:hypothetical protein
VPPFEASRIYRRNDNAKDRRLVGLDREVEQELEACRREQKGFGGKEKGQ